MALHPKKIENVIKLNPEDRYWYTVQEIVKFEVVWLISFADSWVTFVDSESDEILPIWPHREIADRCILEEMKSEGYLVESMDLNSFLNVCLPEMQKGRIFIGVFYDEKREALVIPAEVLESNLCEEMDGE
jgi:hypothetical protein